MWPAKFTVVGELEFLEKTTVYREVFGYLCYGGTRVLTKNNWALSKVQVEHISQWLSHSSEWEPSYISLRTVVTAEHQFIKAVL